MLGRLHRAYRHTGADLPFGNPLAAHGVSMEGYFWRVSTPERAVIALIGVNRGPQGPWATLGLAAAPHGGLALADPDGAWADPGALGVRVETPDAAFVADAHQVAVRIGANSLELTVAQAIPWSRPRFGGSSYFHSVPGLNQYWHPWLLGGRASGVAVVDGQRWEFTDAAVYGEKNWGREGFPDSWWWGQANAFDDPGACVAFAGGQVTAGPLRTEVTGLVVRLPDGTLLRLGNPVTSPVHARVTDTEWHLRGRGAGGWAVEVTGSAPLDDAHVLPVPLPSERRNAPGAIEHLAGALDVTVRRGGRTVWRGSTAVAGLEHGGRARAEAELRRRGLPDTDPGAPPPR